MLHQIGNGALGPVFRAYDQDRDRLVAIKLFRLDVPPERVHQLTAEFERLIAAELQHSVIAAPRATGIDGNYAYLVQDFAAADSLDIVVRENGAAPPGEAVRVAAQLADALDYAAERQVVHGALHPRDILLSQDDIRIVGLGVARALERVGISVPVRLPYAPPERINDGGWDRTADVFGLAAIVYELMTGKRVTGTGSEAAESLPEVPGADMEALQRVFALALAADPSYRYPTASAFVEALKDALGVETETPKSKAKRARPKLRVVAPEVEPELPLNEALLEVQEVPEVPEVREVSEVQEVREDREVREVEAPRVRAPRRRRAPAPTPVAIETVANELTLEPEPVVEEVAEPVIELFRETELVAEEAGEPERLSQLQAEPEPELEREPEREIELVLPPFIQPMAVEPLLAAEPEPVEAPRPAPVFAFEPFEPEPVPEPVIEVAEPEAGPSPEPLSSTSVFVAPAHSPSPVWPIGVAAVIGIALGFGAGYTVAIRDRAAAPVVASTAAAPPAAEPAPAPPGTDSTAVAPAPAVQPTVVQQRVVENPIVLTPAPKETAPAAPAFAGRVLVRSTPPGARVIVDGKDRGQTPAAIADLGRGEHRVRIVRDGYTAAERRIVLSPSQPLQSLSVPLSKEPRSRGRVAVPPPPVAPKANAAASAEAGVGTLIVESRPQGAAVLIDGRQVGTTPLNLGDVRAGSHAVRIERDGYRTWMAGITISAGEQNRVTASLEK